MTFASFATNQKLATVNDPAFNAALIGYWQEHNLSKVKDSSDSIDSLSGTA